MTQVVVLETRVTNLEELMAQLITTVNHVDHQVAQLSIEMRGFKDEMRDFKDEMRDFKDEMREFKDEMLDFKDEMREFKDEMLDFKDEMRGFKDEMLDFKDEMRGFKDEMLDYKEESRSEIQKMRKQWGELSNRMGTMVEDLVAPSIGRILRTVVNCPEEQVSTVAIRVKRRRSGDNQQHEFDAIAVCGEYMLINETKSRLDPEDITAFAQFLPEVRTYFPEYADRKIIGAIASLYVDESLVRRGERLGLVVLGFGEDVMDVLNTPDFKPKAF